MKIMDKKTLGILLLIVGLVIGLAAGWLLFSGTFNSTGNAKQVLNNTIKNPNPNNIVCVCDNGQSPPSGCQQGTTGGCNQCCIEIYNLGGTLIQT
jgi:hypothetical protein